MWLLVDMKAPSFATIENFIRNNLTHTIENIFVEINKVIFQKEKVDLDHTYIDGTKMEANANKYSWVWKKSCIKNRDKTFEKVSEIIDIINVEDLELMNVKIEKRSEYTIEYLEQMLEKYRRICCIDVEKFVHGKGVRKTNY